MYNIIDPTTQNTVYNPTSAQGQWFQHRWGSREYPDVSLEFDWVKSRISRDLKYDIHSVYGDPLLWPELVRFAKWCKIKPEVFTYANTDNTNTLELLRDIGCYTVIKIDGIHELCGLVHLNAQWQKICKGIESVNGRGGVELHTFEHNVHQIPELYEICEKNKVQLFLSCDSKNDEFGTSIIDKNCNWLYDVNPYDTGIHQVDESNINLFETKFSAESQILPQKNLWAYKSLRTYMPVERHRSITERPLIAKTSVLPEVEKKFYNEYNNCEGSFVTPDKKILWNHKLYTMYMYLLANDWKMDRKYLQKNKDNNFVQEVLLYANHIVEDVIQQTQ